MISLSILHVLACDLQYNHQRTRVKYFSFSAVYKLSLKGMLEYMLLFDVPHVQVTFLVAALNRTMNMIVLDNSGQSLGNRHAFFILDFLY